MTGAAAAVPKLELHLHLEGAAPPALARARAAAAGVAPEGLFSGLGAYAWEGFSGFLAAYDRVAALFATPEAQRDLAEAVLAECARHGVIYAEIAISPDLAAGADPGRWREHLAAIGEGAAAAERAHGIEARWIATCIRDLGPERGEAAARLAAGTQGAGVVGLGLAGDERKGRPGDWARAFALAREAGLGLTAHAGEFAGPESVAGALDGLGVDRIDHGVRAAEDPALVRRLAAEGVTLCACPGSNVALGVYPELGAHPLPALRAAGVPVTVSTDDPPFFDTDMTREYEALARVFGWGGDAFEALARDALAAAFCDAGTRARLSRRLDAFGAGWHEGPAERGDPA